MSRPHSPSTPPSPETGQPPPKLFRVDGAFGTRMLPPPQSLPADPTTGLHRPHSISTPSSSYYPGHSVHSLELSKPRSQSYPTNIAQSSRLYSVTRPSAAHTKVVFELSEEQKQQPPTQPIAQIRPACIPCRKKKVGCDLRHPGNLSSPPCNRCRADNVNCLFSNPPSLAPSSSTSPSLSATPSMATAKTANFTFATTTPSDGGGKTATLAALNESNSTSQTAVELNGQALPSLRDLACPHCSSIFLCDDDLRLHLRTQCPEKHYVCTTCHSRFKRLNDLDRHCRIHTGERPHKCDICRRTFSRATTLTRHKQGPEGCAGRRADIGRRRLGSFQGPAPEPTVESINELEVVSEEPIEQTEIVTAGDEEGADETEEGVHAVMVERERINRIQMQKRDDGIGVHSRPAEPIVDVTQVHRTETYATSEKTTDVIKTTEIT